MRARGRAVAAALTAVTVGTTLPGWASPASPQPTASVATYVQGTQTPVNLASASWSKVTPGCGGVMTVSGPSVSGTTTVATGAMTSRWFRPRGGRLLALSLAQDGNTVWRPLPESFDARVRLRVRGDQWSRWFDMRMTLEPSSPPVPELLVQFRMGVGIVLSEPVRKGHPLPVQQLQVRLVDTATSTATLDDEFRVTVGC